MQQRWRIGGIYHFSHKEGYWEGDVLILGYRPGWFEGTNLVEVEYLSRPIPEEFGDGKSVALHAGYDWGYNEVELKLENE